MAAMRALVRRPGPRLTEGIVAHGERVPVNLELALLQWEVYVGTLQQHGWEIIEVPNADDCPDAVFIEDTMVVYRNVAVIAMPGAVARQAEIIDAERIIEEQGYSINRIRPPGTLDGGDILKVPGRDGHSDVVYVGRSDRTNGEGVRQLRAILSPLGATVVAVPLTKVLHLKSAVTALPDGTVIGWADALDDPAIFPGFIAMPEESGAHVVHLDDTTLLVAKNAPRSIALLEDLGYHTVTVDISEFVKLEGCVTCLSVRLRY